MESENAIRALLEKEEQDEKRRQDQEHDDELLAKKLADQKEVIKHQVLFSLSLSLSLAVVRPPPPQITQLRIGFAHRTTLI